VAELAELGCEAEVASCDVTDREALATALASIPEERPLTAVIHSAGALDDGTIESLDAERVDRVMRPKVDAALHLHELTKGIVPALLRDLVRVPARRARDDGGEALARRLSEVPESDRDAVLLELVGTHVAAVLGHASAAALDLECAFKELGFDSLAAVELRN